MVAAGLVFGDRPASQTHIPTWNRYLVSSKGLKVHVSVWGHRKYPCSGLRKPLHGYPAIQGPTAGHHAIHSPFSESTLCQALYTAHAWSLPKPSILYPHGVSSIISMPHFLMRNWRFSEVGSLAQGQTVVKVGAGCQHSRPTPQAMRPLVPARDCPPGSYRCLCWCFLSQVWPPQPICKALD